MMFITHVACRLLDIGVMIIHILCLFMKISDTSSDVSLQEVLQDDEIMARLVEAGHNKSLNQLSLNHGSDIVLMTQVAFHLFPKINAVMDQIREGLGWLDLCFF